MLALRLLSRLPARFCAITAQCSSSAETNADDSSKPRYSLPSMRSEFSIPQGFDIRTWFPMHMSVQMKRMEGKLRAMDLIIEVHDARIPISGRNSTFQQSLYAIRPHILVMNKMDLISMKRYKKDVEDYYLERGVKHILWTDCKRHANKALQDLKASMLDVLTKEPRYNREQKAEYQVMVVGIPNVGKSSLVNALRTNTLGISKKAVSVGARPGMTVRVQNKVRIMDIPPIYMTDTPGVLMPSYRSVDEAMKLSLCHLILESQTNPYYMADYLLYWLNKARDFSYVRMLKLEAPSDDIAEVLLKTCVNNDMRVTRLISGIGHQERWDIDGAAAYFVRLYRDGKFQDSCLDKDILRECKSNYYGD